MPLLMLVKERNPDQTIISIECRPLLSKSPNKLREATRIWSNMAQANHLSVRRDIGYNHGIDQLLDLSSQARLTH